MRLGQCLCIHKQLRRKLWQNTCTVRACVAPSSLACNVGEHDLSWVVTSRNTAPARVGTCGSATNQMLCSASMEHRHDQPMRTEQPFHVLSCRRKLSIGDNVVLKPLLTRSVRDLWREHGFKSQLDKCGQTTQKMLQSGGPTKVGHTALRRV